MLVTAMSTAILTETAILTTFYGGMAVVETQFEWDLGFKLVKMTLEGDTWYLGRV